ncbi:hypothetical protein CORC01_05717 [Colletotrichum orchidophilum]|uniref:Uncharacterized protein n=1 Tax=Colletotrichum orchidophilum TaxID=1209926 RepID=A0A1G4BCD8_9PEZI|nr:uncharacterized protein CORC01_05717 [Colletotrichum orchidophilum]OHE99027.1 hypothetical protein CORC01_05717 [Colletotrichum orchidophilum]
MRPARTPAAECVGFQFCHVQSQCFPTPPGTRPRSQVRARAQCPNRKSRQRQCSSFPQRPVPFGLGSCIQV